MVLPILGAFNSVFFVLCLFVTGIYYFVTKRFFLFFLLLFIYKYGSPQFATIDKTVLGVISTILTIYFSIFYFRNLKSINSNGGLPFLLFFVYILLTSFTSLLPELTFFRGVGLLLGGFSCLFLVNFRSEAIVEFFCNLFIALTITSAILPGDLLLMNQKLSLHCGILNHSQTYGWVMTCCLPFFLMKTKHDKEAKYFNLIVLLLGVYFIYATHMRSALITLFALSLFAIFFTNIFGEIRNFSLFLVLIFFSFLFSIGGGGFLNKIFDKRGVEVENINNMEEMFQSRNQLLEPSLKNFYNKPILGIGYGIPTESTNANFDYMNRWGIGYFPGTKIIISYPVEKGVLYTAILEELGIIGFVLFLNIILRAFKRYSNNIIFIIPILFLSLGEASLFSLGGAGIFGFLILGMCLLTKIDLLSHYRK